MKNLILTLLILLVSTIFVFSQPLINWEWNTTTNLNYTDIEYKDGFVYSVGNSNNGIFISKTDTLGNTIWSNLYLGNAKLSNLCVDSLGSIYAVGYFSATISVGAVSLTSISGNDILVIKLDSIGNVNLAKRAGGFLNDQGIDIAVDYALNIFVIANTGGNLTFAGKTSTSNSSVSLLKYDMGGAEIKHNFMYGASAGSLGPGGGYATALKYSQIDSTVVFSINLSGAFRYDQSQWFSFFPYAYNYGTGIATAILKVNKNGYCGIILNNDSYDNYIETTDLAIHENGNVYHATTDKYSLNGYKWNYIYTVEMDTSNKVNIGFGSDCNWNSFSSGAYGGGKTVKLFYRSNTLYALIYQPDLSCGNLNCSNYYIRKIKTIDNTSTFESLDPIYNYGGIAGNEGSCFVGSHVGLGKSCVTNCDTSFSLNPALDKTMCTSSVQIGNPSCYYVKGGTPPYTYSWSPAIGLSSTTIPQPSVLNITNNITYTLTVTDQQANVLYDTVNVTMGGNASSSLNVSICSSQISYQIGNYSLSTTGTYIIPFTNSNSCDSLVTVNLTVNPSPLSNNYDTICANCLPYLWNGLSIINEGNYTVILPSSTTCDSIAKLTLTIEQVGMYGPYANSSLYDTTCSSAVPYLWKGQSLTTSGIYTHASYIGPTTCLKVDTLFLTVNQTSSSNTSMSIDPNLLPLTWNGQTISNGGIYSHTFIDINGCDSIVTIDISISPLSINPTANVDEENISLYPNPTSNTITLTYSLTESSSISIQLFDVAGKLIVEIAKQEMQNKGKHLKEINLRKLGISSGTYFLQVNDGIRNWNERVVYQE